MAADRDAMAGRKNATSAETDSGGGGGNATEKVTGAGGGQPKTTLVNLAYDHIRREIMEGTLGPNTQMLEQELAERLEMSRTPVREALIRLMREGLIEILPRRGMRVLPISVEDMGEIYEVVTILEARAAERLAEQRPTRKFLQPMIAANTAMRHALDAGDLLAWAEADDRFHAALTQLCGNRRLADMAATVSVQLHRARIATLHLRPRPSRSNQDHVALVDAILAGDSERAYQIHYQHRKRAMTLLMRILTEQNISAL